MFFSSEFIDKSVELARGWGKSETEDESELLTQKRNKITLAIMESKNCPQYPLENVSVAHAN